MGEAKDSRPLRDGEICHQDLVSKVMKLRLWIGILIAMNLQTSFLTPPFGFSLFYLKGVAPPSITTGQIYRGIIPFIIIQLIGLTLIILFPEMSTWLPRVLIGE